jgi:4-amino-4-deoxy-L-arabinose transferase-like glycosyltransferase
MAEVLECDNLRHRDYLGLALYGLLFFGFSLVGGRPLTMHEAVLPETSREMLADRDWVVPKNGGRPWLESPPLPQWITVGVASLFGRCDEVWIARIPPALMATCAVLLAAWMAANWFGRTVGLLSGFVLATTYEFTQYAWLAEDEIFLCTLSTAAVALFARTEFFQRESSALGTRNFFKKRSWGLLALFAVLGLTNLAKGLLFGTVMTLVPIAGFLLWNADWRRIAWYFWFWGWLAFVAIAAAWPLAAYSRIPEVVDLWMFDHVGRLNGGYEDITQPWYYYAKMLPTNLAPWTIVVPLALWITRSRALTVRYSAERFVWCWSLLPPIVFSIPSGKHHHYMLHCTAPWAMLSALALVRLRGQVMQWPSRYRNPLNSLVTLALPVEVALWVVRHKIAGPEWLVPAAMLVWPVLVVAFSWATSHENPRVAATGLFATITLLFCAGHWYAGAYKDLCRDDTLFLQAAKAQSPRELPMLINADMKSLDEFRMQFYLGDRATAIHNLTFLADEKLPRDLFVVSRAGHESEIAQYGDVERIATSAHTRREKSPADRLTLFRVKLHENLPRYSTAGVSISPMQTQGRAPGPFLGPPRVAQAGR